MKTYTLEDERWDKILLKVGVILLLSGTVSAIFNFGLVSYAILNLGFFTGSLIGIFYEWTRFKEVKQ